jgi:Flp pilus assembly pilin Flp
MKLKSAKKKFVLRSQRGQAVVEYVILIVVIALAALLVLTAFSDRLREMIAGVTNTLGGEAEASKGDTAEMLKDLDSDGLEVE